MKSFGGTFVLSGHYDTSVVWREHLHKDSPFVYGDLQTGDIKLNDTVPNPVAEIAQGLTVKPFAFVCGGDPYHTAHIPTRSTSICVWTHGPANLVKDSVRCLLNINLNRNPAQATNYAELVQRRVFEQMPGHYVMQMGYFSKRGGRVLLCARGLILYMWLTHLNGVYTLTWSTNPMHIERSKPFVPDHMQHDFFTYPLALVNGSLALQPAYLVSKFNRHLREAPSPSNRLTVISYMANYLNRSIQYFA